MRYQNHILYLDRKSRFCVILRCPFVSHKSASEKKLVMGKMARRAKRTRGVSQSGEAKSISQAPYQKVQNHMAPLAPLHDEQIAQIDRKAKELIAHYGIEVMCDKARALYKSAGAEVDEASHIVRLDPAMVDKLLSSVPSEVIVYSTNDERALILGGNHIHFGMVSGAPNVHDEINGRRAGNFADYQNFIKLGQSFNAIHFFGNQTLSPSDLAVNTRHLDTNLINLTLSDKPFLSMSIGRERVMDTAKMIAIARGCSLDDLRKAPGAITNISINSPRKFDSEMSSALIALAELGQPVVVTPFTLMGAMTPVTLPAALAQQHAEALFAICLSQIVRKGSPMIYGGFTSNVDMKSGAPAFGTPENSLANMAGGQLARLYNLPYRTSACSASTSVDAQAVWETQMALWGAVTGHGNMIYHAAGWSEGGLVASYEKLVVDCEMIQAMTALLKPQSFTEDDFGFTAHDEVAPGGHFFGAGHTMERYTDAFYSPFLSDWSNYESWQEQGAKTATHRATEIWNKMLAEYEKPQLPQDREEALIEFVAKRKAEIGTRDI